jgi:large subunit ribosomal protein L18
MRHEKQTGLQRTTRATRVRRRIKRVNNRPRLSVFRSHKNFYAQIIDDEAGKTLVCASTVESQLQGELKYGGNKTAAAAVGKLIAQRAIEKGIKEVALDRREYKYHGRVAALADAAREAGLVL